jgi:hypothetical protein
MYRRSFAGCPTIKAVRSPPHFTTISLQTFPKTKSNHLDDPPKLSWTMFQQNGLAWLMALTSAVWLVFTIAYAYGISSTSGILGALIPSVISASHALLVLRILSEGVTILFTALVASSASIIMWAAANTERGITISTWLSMSQNTGGFGLLKLLYWKSLANLRQDFHVPWIAARY